MLSAILLTTVNISSITVSHQLLVKLTLLFGVLQLCNFYRQRFYLDWRQEFGIHWRVFLLHYAKWPSFIMALFDVIMNRNIPYELTKKVKTDSRSHMLFLPHLLIIFFIILSLIIGSISGRELNPYLFFIAILVTILSTVLIVTAWFKFPDPFNKRIVNNRFS